MAGRKTNEERQAILNKIADARKGGMSLNDALATSGISDATYYKWRKSEKPAPKQSKSKTVKKSKSSFMTVSVPEDTTPFVFIMGKASDVHGALDRLSQIQRRG